MLCPGLVLEKQWDWSLCRKMSVWIKVLGCHHPPLSPLNTWEEGCEEKEAGGNPKGFALGFGMRPDSRLCSDTHTHSPALERLGEWVVVTQQPVLDVIHKPRNQPQRFKTRCTDRAFKSGHRGRVAGGLWESVPYLLLVMWMQAWAQPVSSETGESTSDFRSKIWGFRLFPRQAFAWKLNMYQWRSNKLNIKAISNCLNSWGSQCNLMCKHAWSCPTLQPLELWPSRLLCA